MHGGTGRHVFAMNGVEKLLRSRELRLGSANVSSMLTGSSVSEDQAGSLLAPRR